LLNFSLYKDGVWVPFRVIFHKHGFGFFQTIVGD
jgi:hypothetical protein